VTYCGLYTREERRQVVFGVADEVLTGLHAMDAVSEPTRFTAVAVVFDPESVKRVDDELCLQAGDVLLHTYLLGADRIGDRVTGVQVADHSGIHELAATAFVDATGEADLAQHAGADVRYGTDGWVQNGTLGVRFGGLAPDAEITRDSLRTAVQKAKHAGVAGLTAETGLIARVPMSGDLITYLAGEGYDARDAAQTSRAELSARRQAQRYLHVIRTLPGCSTTYIVSTGPELGTRESRHLCGRYQLTAGSTHSPADRGRRRGRGLAHRIPPGPRYPLRMAVHRRSRVLRHTARRAAQCQHRQPVRGRTHRRRRPRRRRLATRNGHRVRHRTRCRRRRGPDRPRRRSAPQRRPYRTRPAGSTAALAVLSRDVGDGATF
jgi:hypothetical protein